MTERENVWNWAMFVVPCLALFAVGVYVPVVWRWLDTWAPVVRDVLNLGLAALGARLAWLSIRMGRENEAVTAKQVQILGKLEELEGKQAAIAEKQHEMAVAQLSKKPDLGVRYRSKSTAHVNDTTDRLEYGLDITNFGSRGTSDVAWRVLFRQPGHPLMVTADTGHTDVRKSEGWDDDHCPMLVVEGKYPGPIHQGHWVPWISIVVDQQRSAPEGMLLRYCEYVFYCEDGRFPRVELGKFELSTKTFVEFTEEDIDAAANAVDNPGETNT